VVESGKYCAGIGLYECTDSSQKRSQNKNLDTATVEAEISVASNVLQAHEAVIDGDSQPTTAGTAVVKEDDALQLKARNARPSKQ